MFYSLRGARGPKNVVIYGLRGARGSENLVFYSLRGARGPKNVRFGPENTCEMKATVFNDFGTGPGARARGGAPLASLERQILLHTPTRVGG